MTSDDRLRVCDVVDFKNSLSDSTSMVIVDRIYGVIEDYSCTVNVQNLLELYWL